MLQAHSLVFLLFMSLFGIDGTMCCVHVARGRTLGNNQFVAILASFSSTIVSFEARAHLTPLMFQQPDQRSLRREDQREGTTEEQERGGREG